MNSYDKLYGKVQEDRESPPIDLMAQVMGKPHRMPPPTPESVDALEHAGLPSDQVEMLRQSLPAAPKYTKPTEIERLEKEIAHLKALQEAALRAEARQAKNSRPSWDQTFKTQYEALEQRSTCPRLRVACIAERDHQVLASGYNGAPRGLSHCDDVGCLVVEGHCIRAVHDSQNLVAQAGRLGISLLGATFRSRYLPCTRCALLLIQVGISEIVYEEVYGNGGSEAIDFLCQAKVALRTIA